MHANINNIHAALLLDKISGNIININCAIVGIENILRLYNDKTRIMIKHEI